MAVRVTVAVRVAVAVRRFHVDWGNCNMRVRNTVEVKGGLDMRMLVGVHSRVHVGVRVLVLVGVYRLWNRNSNRSWNWPWHRPWHRPRNRCRLVDWHRDRDRDRHRNWNWTRHRTVDDLEECLRGVLVDRLRSWYRDRLRLRLVNEDNFWNFESLRDRNGAVAELSTRNRDDAVDWERPVDDTRVLCVHRHLNKEWDRLVDDAIAIDRDRRWDGHDDTNLVGAVNDLRDGNGAIMDCKL